MTGLIERIPAETMARVYAEALPKVRQALDLIADATEELNAAFQLEYGGFSIDLEIDGEKIRSYCRAGSDDSRDRRTEAYETIADRFKRRAWGALIEKLGIRKLMSSGRVAELDDAIHGQRRNYDRDANSGQDLPEITPDTLFDVLAGMVSSADEFMQEAIQEEYDFWKPSHQTEYKTNSGPFALGPKVIREWMIEAGYPSGFYPRHDRQKHMIALDNIFHRLDGQGVPTGYAGPLVDAIKTCGRDGSGETDYFRFRCFKNGNLHLWFKRADLLQKFNELAGRPRLPETATH